MRIKPFLVEVHYPSHIGKCDDKLRYGREMFDHHTVKCYDTIFVDTEIEAVEGDLCFDVNLNKTFIVDANRIDSFKKTSKRWPGLPKNFYKVVFTADKIYESIPKLSKKSTVTILSTYNKNGKMPEWVDVEECMVEYRTSVEDSGVAETIFEKPEIKFNSKGFVDITIPTPLLSRALDQDASKSLSKILLEDNKRLFTSKDMNDFAQWYFENMGKFSDDYLDMWLKEK